MQHARRSPYLTAPVPSREMPSGIPYIIGNEAAERYSFYGMRAILVLFMTQHLQSRGGEDAFMSEPDATAVFHLFVASAYFFPFFGAILSDVFLGKYRTILLLSSVYCLGHLALALDETLVGLYIGLTLIAVGSGGIKPCVSAHVGDQFGATNQHLLPMVFAWFYFAINIGSAFSMLLAEELLNRGSPRLAFGVPGVLMALATLVFWLGRHRFVHIPPGGLGFIRETFSGEGLRALGKLAVIYIFVAAFWSLFDQTGSSWIFQAEDMNRHFLGYNWGSSQIQAVNPVLVLAFIPLFSYVVYPLINRVFPLTALRKISIGLFVTSTSFGVSTWIQYMIEAGGRPTIGWQILAYVLLTAGEIMVSITCLEFSYTQAPKRMKSFIMALFLLSISAGNLFTSLVNVFIQNADGTSKLEGPAYFWFFTGVMLAAAVLFIFVAMNYREKTHLQDEGAEAA